MLRHIAIKFIEALSPVLFNTQIICVLNFDLLADMAFSDYCAFTLLERSAEKVSSTIYETILTFQFRLKTAISPRDLQIYASQYDIVDSVFEALQGVKLGIDSSVKVSDQPGDPVADEMGDYSIHLFKVEIRTRAGFDCFPVEEIAPSDFQNVQLVVKATGEV